MLSEVVQIDDKRTVFNATGHDGDIERACEVPGKHGDHIDLHLGEGRRTGHLGTTPWNLSDGFCTIEHMFDSELTPRFSNRELEAISAAELVAWDEMASDREMIPGGLDEWGPGPFLAAVLSSIDASWLNGHDAVVVMKARARQVAHDSLERLPAVWDALESGDIDLRKAAGDRTWHRPPGWPHRPQGGGRPHHRASHRDDDRAVASPPQTLCIEVNPEDAKKRLENAVEDRRIIIDHKTLAGLSEAPDDLAGYGPVIADTARQVAATQTGVEWRTTVTDQHGDIDHTTPWSQGGQTSIENNAPLCRHDHVGRHKAGWGYTRLPDGQHQWTSPHGHTYITTADRPP